MKQKVGKQNGGRIALSALALFASACEPGTGGRPITFTLALSSASVAQGAPHGRFVTHTGWEVTIEEACIAVGPVYFFAGASHLQQAARVRGVAERLSTLLWPRAHAHPGDTHFRGGEVRGEWLGQVALDALAPAATPLGDQNGLAGAVGSFSLRLDPPGGPLIDDPCLRGHHAWAHGTASKDGAQIAFEGGLDIAAVGTNRRVDGLPLVGAFEDGTAVVIAVRPSVWFDQAEFDSLVKKAPSGRWQITPESQVHRAWFIGARANGAFVGEVTGPQVR
ncbi:MAG: hypothetical protein KA712_10405 [Myxococcales bacterium]|nr:hypothetical protein [Myxococcales bacterium]